MYTLKNNAMNIFHLLHSGQCFLNLSIEYVCTHVYHLYTGKNQINLTRKNTSLLLSFASGGVTIFFLKHSPLASRTSACLLLWTTPSHSVLQCWCPPGSVCSPVLPLRLSTWWWAHAPETLAPSSGPACLSGTSSVQPSPGCHNLTSSTD